MIQTRVRGEKHGRSNSPPEGDRCAKRSRAGRWAGGAKTTDVPDRRERESGEKRRGLYTGGSNWSYAETKASNNAEAADLLASAQAIGATAQNRVHMPQSMNHTSHWKPLLLAVQRDQTTHAWSGTTILNPHQVTNRQKDGTPKTRAKAHPLTRLYLPGACEKEELFEGTWHAAQRHAHAGVRASCTDGAPSHVDGHAHKPEQQEAKPGPRRPTRAHVKRPA